MSAPDAIRAVPVEFAASDGAELVGDLAVPLVVRAAAIVCHPHPQYGGNRHSMVVTSVAEALATHAIAALRFDFRRQFDDGVGERLDAIAALDELNVEFPDIPLFAVGYSFGALVALSLGDARVRKLVLIAPPLRAVGGSAPPKVPTLVIVPAHDQFGPPSVTDPILDEWRAATDAPIDREIVESADHSLVGHTRDVASRTARWLTSST